MWKKTDEPQPPAPRPAAPPAPKAAPSPAASVLGPSIFIKGDLTGKEDLVIEGKVEGAVRFEANNVTIGPEGRIRADIYGRSVHVEGAVKGHLFGEQEVVIRASGKVQGDIVSPRVVLENGSNFKGSIDMEPAKQAEEAAKKAPEKKTVASAPSGSAPTPVAAATKSTESSDAPSA